METTLRRPADSSIRHLVLLPAGALGAGSATVIYSTSGIGYLALRLTAWFDGGPEISSHCEQLGKNSGSENGNHKGSQLPGRGFRADSTAPSTTYSVAVRLPYNTQTTQLRSGLVR